MTLPLHVIAVGVGVYDDPGYASLHDAESDAQAVADVWQRLGATVTVIRSGTVGELADQLTAAFAETSAPALIVYWTGHGDLSGSATGGLSLIGRNSAYGKATTLKPASIAELALGTAAEAILILIDTCFSGGAVPAVTATAADLLNQAGAATGRSERWLALVPSTRAWEPAKASHFAEHVRRLFDSGPRHPDARVRWSEHDEFLYGQDILFAIEADWPASAASLPIGAPVGRNRRIFPNPLYRQRAPAGVVEHLLQAARSDASTSWNFVGRTVVVDRLVDIMTSTHRGIHVLTAPAGAGKSAVLGFICAMADPEQRGSIGSDVLATYADPGVGAVSASVYARRLSVDQVARELDIRLSDQGVLPQNRRGARGPGEVVDAVREAAGHRRVTIVVDGLDEAGADAWAIAEQLVLPLRRYAFVLVGTRDMTADTTDSSASLLATLDPSTLDRTDLRDWVDDVGDISTYVARRLYGVSPSMDASAVANHVSRVAGPGGFLLARIVASQFVGHPVDTSDRRWRVEVPSTIVDAVLRDLGTIPGLRGTPDAPARSVALQLLTALAHSAGSGFPVDVWSVAAQSMDAGMAEVTIDDIYSTLPLIARYVVVDGEAGVAVYRLAHPALTAALAVSDLGRVRRLATALVRQYETQLAAGGQPRDPAYLWRYTWRHCADAGTSGITALRRLTARDPGSFEPDLARALNSVAIRQAGARRPRAAVTSVTEAVEIRRRLALADPATHEPDLAQSLNNLAVRQGNVDALVDALASITEAVSIRRRLAADNPTAFEPVLARSLHNLSVRQAALGAGEDALASISEAVAIRRRLAAENPTAFAADLARSLRSLALRQAERGDDTGALASMTEATALASPGQPP